MSGLAKDAMGGKGTVKYCGYKNKSAHGLRNKRKAHFQKLRMAEIWAAEKRAEQRERAEMRDGGYDGDPFAWENE